MSNAGVTRRAAPMTTVVLDAPGLGDRSYLISDGEVGVVVDPQRDPFPYLQEAEKLGVSITVVLETHIHNDYRSEEHTSELQSLRHLVCRLLLEKKKTV